MPSYPSTKVHRVNRKKLGRGQFTQIAAATFAMTSTGDTATLTFDVPVIVEDTIPLAVSGGVTLVSQTVVSATVVRQLFSGPLAGLTWSVAGGTGQVATFQGGGLASSSGTF